MNLYRTLRVSTLFSLGIFFLVSVTSAHAATLSATFSPASVLPGKTFTATVHMNSGEDTINALEGSITIPDGVSISSVTPGSSAFSIWAKAPVYVISDGKISFIGGTPKAIAAHTDVEVFTFTGSSNMAGTFNFVPEAVTAYRADGKGTKVDVAAAAMHISVNGTAPVSDGVTPKDTVSPIFVDVSVGKDPALFNGSYFVTFLATDEGTGIDHYEVQEGWMKPFVRADRYYVLKDQTLSTTITVIAVDKAGNKSSKTIAPTHPRVAMWEYLLGALVLAALLVVLFMVRKRKKSI